MILLVKVKLNPDLYHGSCSEKNHFEGWYFKLVTSGKDYTIAIIPGVSFGKTLEDSHSFIQVLDGTNCNFEYNRYPVSTFSYDKSSFNFKIGMSKFSGYEITLNIENPNFPISGTVKFDNIIKWPDSILNPGSMGFYNYFTFMQCYSQVCAMSIDLRGTLTIDGKTVDFTGGKGYIEKNWGKAFPNSWIWVQCNNFYKNDISLSCSIGHIPFLFTSFRGFLIGLQVKDKFYKFTTINRSKIDVKTKGNDIMVKVTNHSYTLTLDVNSNHNEFLYIIGPRDGKMIPLVDETLAGNLKLTLVDNKSGEILIQEVGSNVGVEYGGDQRLVL